MGKLYYMSEVEKKKEKRKHSREWSEKLVRRNQEDANYKVLTEKLARVAREEARIEQHTDENIVFLDGPCQLRSCGDEAACHPAENDTKHYCRCTNNGKPTTDNFKCPRNTVPLTPKPIHNVLPPGVNNTSVVGKYATASPTAQVPRSLVSSEAVTDHARRDGTVIGGSISVSSAKIENIAIGGAFVMVIFIATAIICCIKRNKCRVTAKAQPRVRPGEPLLAERYITNPQYGLCGAGGGMVATLTTLVPPSMPFANGTDGGQVPLLDRNTVSYLEEIGEGCFGKVHKGLLKTSDGEKVIAIKVLKESAGRSAEDDFVREVSIMSTFKHPNILTLIGIVYKDDTSASPSMVFEYMEWGDLAGVLRGGNRGGPRAGSGAPALSEAALLLVALQVARGMQYLAARRFVHRDLAARNCLVGASLAVKIADFGMSRDVYTCDYYKMGGERPMPVRWMSPESILFARFTHESDVWSYGVVLWEIYSRGRQPYYGHNNDGATKLILKGIQLEAPEGCPAFACKLMRECWKSDPIERIGFDDICKELETTERQPSSVRLPRPPTVPMDSAGYLVPIPCELPDYLPIQASEPSYSSEDEDEDDEEFT